MVLGGIYAVIESATDCMCGFFTRQQGRSFNAVISRFDGLLVRRRSQGLDCQVVAKKRKTFGMFSSNAVGAALAHLLLLSAKH